MYLISFSRGPVNIKFMINGQTGIVEGIVVQETFWNMKIRQWNRLVLRHQAIFKY